MFRARAVEAQCVPGQCHGHTARPPLPSDLDGLKFGGKEHMRNIELWIFGSTASGSPILCTAGLLQSLSASDLC
jgi:hypothetical protein